MNTLVIWTSSDLRVEVNKDDPKWWRKGVIELIWPLSTSSYKRLVLSDLGISDISSPPNNYVITPT